MAYRHTKNHTSSLLIRVKCTLPDFFEIIQKSPKLEKIMKKEKKTKGHTMRCFLEIKFPPKTALYIRYWVDLARSSGVSYSFYFGGKKKLEILSPKARAS